MKWILAFISTLSLLVPPASAQSEHGRVVAIGDIHGDYEAYIEILHAAGLTNETGRRWTGGETQLVQLGDVLDRGPDGLRILEHLEDLADKARRRGGTIHRLAGNHEAMHLTNDFRYVDQGEYEALIDRRSEDRREAFFEYMVEAAGDHALQNEEGFDEDAYRASLLAEWPLGKYEYVVQFADGGEQRERILQLDIVVQIGRFVFVHGGISPEYAAMGINEINARGREDLESGNQSGTALINDPEGPLWHRAYAFQEEGAGEDLSIALEMLEADHMVVGHTPLTGQVSSLYDGNLVLADVGLSAAYRGARSFLEITPDGTMLVWTEGEYHPVSPLTE